MMNFDTTALKDVIRQKAMALAEDKVSKMAKSIETYLQEEFKVDLAQSPQRSLIDKFSDISVGVEKTSDTSFSISVSTSGQSDYEQEVLSTYFDNAKKRMGV